MRYPSVAAAAFDKARYDSGRAQAPRAAEQSPGRHTNLWLAAIAGLSVIPRIVAGLYDPISYDGYWHVFIARNLSREFRSLAHPPLFPLLLRALDALSHSRLSYESVSLVTGAGAVFLFGLLLQKLRTAPPVPIIGGLAFALAPSAIRMSIVVESYMLCVFFILVASLAYLDLLRPDPASVPRASRVVFAASLSLALLSHYVAGLFFLACLVSPFILALVWPDYRRHLSRGWKDRLPADIATVMLPAAVGAILLHYLARPWLHALNHLPAFYFQPGAEPAGAFVARNLANTFNLFSPVRVAAEPAAVALLCVFTVAVCGELATGTERHREARMALATIYLVLLLIGIVTGLGGWYPFGGAMRHQLLLFVFGLLALVLAFDRVLSHCSPGRRYLFVAFFVVGSIANSFGNRGEWWEPGPDLFAGEVASFRKAFAGARVVHVDQFNLIGFFAQYSDWDWRFVGSEIGNKEVQRYALSRGGGALTVLAHRDIWNMDFTRPDLYKALVEPQSSGAPLSFTVFCVHQILPGEPRRSPEMLQREIPELAKEAGLAVERLVVDGPNVYGGFGMSSVPAHPSLAMMSILSASARAQTGRQIKAGDPLAISGRR
jgi:hypothetical protein